MAMTSEQLKAYWNEFSTFYGQNLEESNLNIGISLARMLKIESAKNILEIGCGSGSLSLYCLQKLPAGVKYTSVDLSEEMIKLAEQKKAQVKNKIDKDIDHSFVVGDAENLSFIPDECMDVVIVPLSIHVVSDPEKALKEALRVLKKGGRIGFSVLGPYEKCTFFTLLSNKMAELNIETPKRRSPHHLGEREKLIQLMKDGGVKVDFCWEEDAPTNAFEEKDLIKLITIPRFAKVLEGLDEEKRTQLMEGVKKDFEETKKNFMPLLTNNLLLVGSKPL